MKQKVLLGLRARDGGLGQLILRLELGIWALGIGWWGWGLVILRLGTLNLQVCGFGAESSGVSGMYACGFMAQRLCVRGPGGWGV